MKILKAIVKAILIFSIICSALFVFLYFILGDFPEAQEKRMRNRLLKCKDVVDVVVRNPLGADEIKADVTVYLINNRKLEFGCVHYDMNNKSMWFYQIGNELTRKICYDYRANRSTNKPDCHTDSLSSTYYRLKDITHFFPEIKSVKDVIENYDMLYEVISNLNELPDNTTNWKAFESDYVYYDEKTQNYIKLSKRHLEENN